MKKVLAVILAGIVLPVVVPAARAQNLDDIFRRVNPSVIVVRSKGRDVGAGGVTRFKETGSGVLISSSGKVMTAAHVVNGMDEITVEGVAGEVVSAKIISSDAAADISLLPPRARDSGHAGGADRVPRHGARRPTGAGRRRPLPPR